MIFSLAIQMRWSDGAQDFEMEEQWSWEEEVEFDILESFSSPFSSRDKSLSFKEKRTCLTEDYNVTSWEGFGSSGVCRFYEMEEYVERCQGYRLSMEEEKVAKYCLR